MSTVITLACMGALAGFVYWYMPRDRPRKWFRLEQFRPAAPLAGILDEPEAGPATGNEPGAASPECQSSPVELDSSSSLTGPATHRIDADADPARPHGATIVAS